MEQFWSTSSEASQAEKCLSQQQEQSVVTRSSLTAQPNCSKLTDSF